MRYGEDEIQLLVEVGQFTSSEEALSHAISSLYDCLPLEIRYKVAIHAYKTRDVTVNRAAELAGVGFEAMRDRIIREGIQLREGLPEYLSTQRERTASANRLARLADRDRGTA